MYKLDLNQCSKEQMLIEIRVHWTLVLADGRPLSSSFEGWQGPTGPMIIQGLYINVDSINHQRFNTRHE